MQRRYHLIDSAFGATIHWNRFQKVASAKRLVTWKRLACHLILHRGPYILLLGILLLVSAHNAISVLGDIKTGFDTINTTYSSIDDLYRNIATKLQGFSIEVQKVSDSVSNIISDIPSLASKTTQFASITLAGGSLASSFKSEASSVFSSFISARDTNSIQDVAANISSLAVGI